MCGNAHNIIFQTCKLILSIKFFDTNLTKEKDMKYAIIDLTNAKIVDTLNSYKKQESDKAIGAVAKAKQIFEKMQGKPRKEVLIKCVKQGINPNTASAQYYKYYH